MRLEERRVETDQAGDTPQQENSHNTILSAVCVCVCVDTWHTPNSSMSLFILSFFFSDMTSLTFLVDLPR